MLVALGEYGGGGGGGGFQKRDAGGTVGKEIQ